MLHRLHRSIAGGLDSALGYDEPATIDFTFDVESNIGGVATKVRERVQLAGKGTLLAEIAEVKNAALAGTEYGLVTRGLDDVLDRALRDLGKVDVALLDQYTPDDVDTGGGVVNALPVVLRARKAGGGFLGDATDPIRTQGVGSGSIVSGQQAVTATAAALSANACRRATIKALGTNPRAIYVGPSGVAIGTGFPLYAGDSVALDVSNTNLIFVITDVAGDSSVAFIAEV